MQVVLMKMGQDDWQRRAEWREREGGGGSAEVQP